MNKAIHKVFLALVSREIMIVFALIILAASVPMIVELWRFLRHLDPHTPELVDDIEKMVDSLAGILVAAGVFFESRETIRALARHSKTEENQTQLDLNEVAHHNGLGLLILGLFMEIGTLLIGMPQRMMATRALEIYIFWICFVLVLCSVLILADFIKDFIKSYFGWRPS